MFSELSQLTRLPIQWRNSLFMVAVAYMVTTFGWTFVVFKYIFPFIKYNFIRTNILTLWNTQLTSLVSTWVGEAFFPLVLYFLIVHPLRLKPILNTGTRPNWRRSLLIIVGVAVLFLALTPLSHLTSVDFLVAINMIGVGFAEELSYRGVLTRVFRDKFGVIWAAVFVSFLFSLSHWAEWFYQENIPISSVEKSFLTIFGMGILFTFMAWRSGTLWWAIAIHSLNDFEIRLNPPLGNSWKFGIVLMLCGIIGAEIMHFVSTAKNKSEYLIV